MDTSDKRCGHVTKLNSAHRLREYKTHRQVGPSAVLGPGNETKLSAMANSSTYYGSPKRNSTVEHNRHQNMYVVRKRTGRTSRLNVVAN